MKTTLRIFRIIFKLLLLAYVTVVNFFFITVFLFPAAHHNASYMPRLCTGTL